MNKQIKDLVERRNAILKELNQVTREIEDAQTEVFKHIASEKELVRRYFDGDAIVVRAAKQQESRSPNLELLSLVVSQSRNPLHGWVHS